MSPIAMAKKKPRKSSPTPKREEVVSFRCTPEFKAHLEGIADQETRTPTQVIVRALHLYTESSGYAPFPKR